MKNDGKVSRRHFVSGIASAAAAACLPKSVRAMASTAGAPHASAQSTSRGPHARIEFMAVPFPLADVRLLDSPFLKAAQINEEWLESVPVDRLVHNFRVNANLSSSAEPLGGWEAPDCELRGHYTGHFLSACALSYASTGNDILKQRGDAVVAELAKCQDSLRNGYLSAFPESFFDRLSAGKPVWAPFYTFHKIMAGNLDMYTLCGNEQALANAEKMAGWTSHWLTGFSDAEMQRILRVEWGGMNEALFNLAAIKGNWRYFEAGRRFEHKSFFDPLAGHRDELKGLHVNTHIPQVIGAARAYELTGSPYYHEVASYFWDEVTSERAYATGGTSNGEGWNTDPGDLKGQLSLWSEECCCGYNMLKLTRHLYQWTADPRYFDYYERTLFNSRLGTQDSRGMKMYYLPLATGYWKFFNSEFNSFWCCTGTGAEEFSKFADSIYFHNGDSVFVNLFIPSEVRWKEKGITIRQETRFPAEAGSTFIVKTAQPVEAGVNIRIPTWVGDGGSASVNGKPLEAFSNAGSYLEIRRRWSDGDRIEVKLPMGLHAEPLPGDPTQQAALYGPIVLAGNLGTQDLTREMQYDVDHGTTELSPPHARPVGDSQITVKSPDDFRSMAWLEPVKGEPLTFQTVGQKQATTLIPLNRVIGERYAAYWKVDSGRPSFDE
ncbi:MAG TPA: beta-L-arabinofuranosidase domain-containing protein [Candidatus Limnocylindrales bacterium]|nr:beta-L-arabinofuranosidase domain-containing protein [Candidatus Limnocylindrales bacterium]